MTALLSLVLLGALSCSMGSPPPPPSNYVPCLHPGTDMDMMCQLACYASYGPNNGLTGCCVRERDTVFTGLGTCRCCVLKWPGPYEPGRYYQKCSQISPGDCPNCSCHRPTVSLTPCGQYDPTRPSLPPPSGMGFGVKGNRSLGGPLEYSSFSESDLLTLSRLNVWK